MTRAQTSARSLHSVHPLTRTRRPHYTLCARGQASRHIATAHPTSSTFVRPPSNARGSRMRFGIRAATQSRNLRSSGRRHDNVVSATARPDPSDAPECAHKTPDWAANEHIYIPRLGSARRGSRPRRQHQPERTAKTRRLVKATAALWWPQLSRTQPVCQSLSCLAGDSPCRACGASRPSRGAGGCGRGSWV
jgi:hypothetical protein